MLHGFVFSQVPLLIVWFPTVVLRKYILDYVKWASHDLEHDTLGAKYCIMMTAVFQSMHQIAF